MSAPYPGFPPNYAKVQQTGGLTRRCFVVEIRSLGELDNVQLALVRGALEMAADNLKRRVAIIEKVDVATHDRFDTILSQALRL